MILSVLVYYYTNIFFSVRSFSHLGRLMHWLLVCSSWLIIEVLSELHFEFSLFRVLLIFITSKYSYSEELFRFGTSVSRSLATLPALRCAALWLYWEIWLIYLSNFCSVLLSFLSISKINIHYLFPKICDLSGNFWSEAPFPVK